jgi:hypothetical protein
VGDLDSVPVACLATEFGLRQDDNTLSASVAFTNRAAEVNLVPFQELRPTQLRFLRGIERLCRTLDQQSKEESSLGPDLLIRLKGGASPYLILETMGFDSREAVDRTPER